MGSTLEIFIYSSSPPPPKKNRRCFFDWLCLLDKHISDAGQVIGLLLKPLQVYQLSALYPALGIYVPIGTLIVFWKAEN